MTNKFSYNNNSLKTIWVDLDNSPHVPFFAPIISSLEEKGYNVEITVRNYSQILQLANLFNFEYQPIGKHHGKNKFIKIIGLVFRSLQLLPFALKKKPDIAISHGSRSQMLAAYLLKIPIVLFLDYEYIQTIPFIKPSLIFMPKIISSEKLKSWGPKIIFYPGIKEDLYVPSFKPDRQIMNELGINSKSIKVLMRPPAHEAHYHNPEGEILFNQIIDYLINFDSVQTILLPRDDRQKKHISNNYKKQILKKTIIIPEEVYDGLNLIWHSDLVISGGGTMNREAAALGVPVYSIFKGRIGDVDSYLAKLHKLVIVDNINEIREKVKIEKRMKAGIYKNINSLTLYSINNNLAYFIESIFNSEEKNNLIADNEHELFTYRKSKI